MNGPDIKRGIRPSDEDRNQILDQISRGYGDGRISKAEHDSRVAAVQAAASQEELARLISDLPPADPTGKDLRRARTRLAKQARMRWIEKNTTAGSLTWRRWQLGLTGSLITLFFGVIFLIPVPIVTGNATKGIIPILLRDCIIGLSIPLGILLIALSICMIRWLFDTQKVMRPRGR